MLYAGLINKNIISKLSSSEKKYIGLSGIDGNITESEKRIILRLLGGKNTQLITSQSVFISPKKGIQSPWSSKVKDIFLKCGIDLLNVEKLNLYSFS